LARTASAQLLFQKRRRTSAARRARKAGAKTSCCGKTAPDKNFERKAAVPRRKIARNRIQKKKPGAAGLF
jgi:hypothetical protein